ncbi:MAG TPA: hypothetical protein VHK47_01660 [Polyangia bacterium]|nr:hypothetical protein [Polyangia bacterium]
MAPSARAPLIVLVFVVGFAVVLAATTAARAQTPAPSRARLVYLVDPTAVGCPSADELRAAVNARAGHELFGEPSDRTLDVTIRRRDAAYEATVALPDTPGAAKRELRSDVGCGELATAAALVASIALDPESVLRPAPPPPPPPPPAPVAAPRLWRAFVGLGPRGAWGIAPGTTLGLALSAAATSQHLALGAELAGFAPTDTSFGSGTVSVLPLALAVLPCGMASHLELCAVARAGVMRASGAGFTQNFETWKPFASFGVRAGVFKDLGRLRVRASAEATSVIPVTHLKVDEAVAYSTRGVAFAAGLDVLIFFQ